MTRTARLAGLALLVAASAARSARSEPPPSTEADPDTEIARRHFAAGSALYSDGKYADAIVEFKAAKRAKPLPALDYNIGRCHDRLEHPREAIAAYVLYLAGTPDASDVAEVRARILMLRARVAEAAPPPLRAQPSPPPQSATVDDAPPPLKRHRVATWAVGGAGIAILAGSLVAGLVASARYGTLKNGCAADGGCSLTTVPDAQNLIDGGHAAGLAADVLLGVGIAAVVTSVVLFFVEGRRPVERRAWRLAPSAGGAALAWSAP